MHVYARLVIYGIIFYHVSALKLGNSRDDTPAAAAAPLPAIPFLAVHLYTLGLHLLGGELNLCSSALSSCSSIPQRLFPLPQQSLSPWGGGGSSGERSEL